jgi:hypothetical protein
MSVADHLDPWEVERLETIERAARELVDAMEAGHPDQYAGLVAQLRYALGIRGPAAGNG